VNSLPVLRKIQCLSSNQSDQEGRNQSSEASGPSLEISVTRPSTDGAESPRAAPTVTRSRIYFGRDPIGAETNIYKSTSTRRLILLFYFINIMQFLNPFRGHSDFFKSGFCAFTNRDRKQSSETAPHTMLDISPVKPKTTVSDTTERRPRPVTVHVTVQNAPREKAERRRSSYPSFSTHWFDHQSTPNFFNETSTIFLRRGSTSSAESRDSEVWIAGGGLYTINGRYNTSVS
jgi:hypothetical protein